MTIRNLAILASSFAILLFPLAAAAQESAPTEQGEPAHLARIIVTGNGGGISGQRVRREHERVAERLELADADSVRVRYAGLGARSDGHTILFDLDGLTNVELDTFLAAASPSMASAPVAAIGVSDVGLTYFPDGAEGELQTATEAYAATKDPTLAIRAGGYERLDLPSADVIGLRPEGSAAPISLDAHDWEYLRLTVHEVKKRDGSVTHVVTIPFTWGEGSRRLGTIERLRGESEAAGVPALVLDAGNGVDGYSYLSSQTTSLHRPNDWDALQSVGTRAMAPSLNELIAGTATLKREAADHEIAVVASNVVSKDGSRIFEPGIRTRVGGLSVAVVGVVDPLIEPQLPAEVTDRIQIVDPFDGLRDLAILGGDSPPDIGIVLTVAEPVLSGQLFGALEDIDIVAGDFTAVRWSDRVARYQLAEDSARKRPTVLGHASRIDVSVYDVYGAGKPETVTVHHINVRPDAPRSLTWAQRVSAVRDDVYTNTERVLIPALSDLAEAAPSLAAAMANYGVASGPNANPLHPPKATRALWSQLVANMMRAGTDADVALLRPLRFPGVSAGPMRVLDLMSILAVPDQVVTYEVSGKELEGVLKAAALFEGLTVSGAEPAKGKVEGRKVDHARYYRIVTTDELTARDPLRAAVAKLAGDSRFALSAGSLRQKSSGERVALVQFVKSRLEAMSDANPDPEDYATALEALLAADGRTLTPRWFLAVREVSLAFSQYTNINRNDVYDDAREARATTADNVSVRAVADISLIYESAAVYWELRSWVKFGEVQLEEDTQETDDDFVALTEVRVNALNLSAAAVPIVPFASAAFDTELTVPDERDERQKELRTTVGLVAKLPVFIKELRLGGLMEVDFERDDGPIEGGVEVAAILGSKLGGLAFKGNLEARYMFENANDTNADLGLTIAAKLAIGLPLVQRLKLDTFVDAFVYRGKVAETRDIATSVIVGVQLEWDRVFAW